MTVLRHQDMPVPSFFILNDSPYPYEVSSFVGWAESQSQFPGFAILLWKPAEIRSLKMWGAGTLSRPIPEIFKSINLCIRSGVAANLETQIYCYWFSQGEGMKMSRKAASWWRRGPCPRPDGFQRTRAGCRPTSGLQLWGTWRDAMWNVGSTLHSVRTSALCGGNDTLQISLGL